jgi:sulfate/thiosulfate transport system ATP-binding protein
MIDRILHLGFEVRVELTLGDGEKTWVQTTKGRVQELELTDGEIVWLRPNAPAGDASTDAAVPA